jgi:maltose O-acetyltransferase
MRHPKPSPKQLRQRVISRLRGDSDARRLVARGLRLGENAYINASARLDGGALWLISIGEDTVIGPGVQILAHDATTRRRLGYSIVAPVTIGARVFVGAGSIVLPGATIGDDTIIGAGSVVRGEVPAGKLVVGNPPVVVCDSDEYIARHHKQLDERPHWPSEGWTVKRGITADRMRQMREALEDGIGYLA